MKACLKWLIGTVHIRYICLSLLVILEVEDITRKCTFGHITKKGGRLMTAILTDEHVHEKVFNDRIAELLALFVIKESALYFEGLQLF